MSAVQGFPESDSWHGAQPEGFAPARVVPLPLQQRGSDFSARRIDAGVPGAPIDPWLAVDRFRIAAPTFPPHPHAGFSAITYVLPESPGCMRNRDSQGAHLLIPPGGLHWTAAGSGILHEEVPACGAPVEGLQIFLNHPAASQNDPPRIDHRPPDAVPLVPLGAGSSARILIGQPFAGSSPVTLLDLTLAPQAKFGWAYEGQPASFALVNAGAVDVGPGGTATAGAAIVPNSDGTLQLAAGAAGARVVLFAGQPLHQPVHWLGSICMASREAAEAALLRYRSGAMGALDPYRGKA